MGKLKATILIGMHSRRPRQEALYTLHDCVGRATCRASKEAAAMAKAVAVQAPIDVVSTENDTKDKGAYSSLP